MYLIKFANDTKLNGAADPSAGRATLQNDLNRLEEWLTGTLWSKTKTCKVFWTGPDGP